MLKKGAIVLIVVSMLWLVAIILARTTLANDVHHPMNTRWRLVSYTFNGVKTELPEDSELGVGLITIEFTDTDSVSGASGCNGFFGSFKINNDKIEFTEMGQTLMACFPIEIMDQEQAFLNALRLSGKFKINNNTLIIWYAGGKLNFELTGFVWSQ